jgi:ABC-type sulfate/molybdate transport systems ATPase subunit
VLLDEPFRGLDREARGRLLAAARRRWASATLLCVTHDAAEALAFDRVLVLAAGRIVEDGAPGALASRPNSHLGRFLADQRQLAADLRPGRGWRRLHLRDGRIEPMAPRHNP